MEKLTNNALLTSTTGQEISSMSDSQNTPGAHHTKIIYLFYVCIQEFSNLASD